MGVPPAALVAGAVPDFVAATLAQIRDATQMRSPGDDAGDLARLVRPAARPGLKLCIAAYRASLESAAVHGVKWQRVHPGDTSVIDGVRLRFLAPDSTWTAALTDANLASTVLRIEFGSVSMLLVGDAERPEEQWLLEHTSPDLLRADVLKVGHHGSKTSSSPEFLDAVQPRLALVSVGRGNSYGLPSPQVIEAYRNRRIPLLRTDVVGTTVVRTDGRTLSVSTAARQWSLPSRDSLPGSRPLRLFP